MKGRPKRKEKITNFIKIIQHSREQLKTGITEE